MPKNWVLFLSFVTCFSLQAQVESAFMIGINPSSLTFAGPGAHSVGVTITHFGGGFSTLSGYTIRFGLPSDASSGVLPLGVTANSATEVLVLPAPALFSLDPATNTVAGSSLAGDFDIGVNGTATLFNLNLNLGNAASYTIGVDFQNAERGGLLAADISSEFTGQTSPTTDFTFTLTAVPEPNSVLLFGAAIGIYGALRCRNRRVAVIEV